MSNHRREMPSKILTKMSLHNWMNLKIQYPNWLATDHDALFFLEFLCLCEGSFAHLMVAEFKHKSDLWIIELQC